MPSSPARPVRRTPSTPAPRHARVRLTTLAALVAAGLAACGGDDPTGVETPTAETPVIEAASAETDVESPVAASAMLTTSTTYFVSPSGSNTNPGTQAKPFKTLSKALSVAKAGDIIRLGSGIYSPESNGEQFTSGTQQVVVPAGVTIVGALDGPLRVSILQGGREDVGLNLQGSATVKNLSLQGFQTAVIAVGGTQTLSNLFVSGAFTSLGLSGTAQATLTASTIVQINNAAGVRVRGQSRFTMNGGTISGGAPNCGAGGFGILVENRGQVTLKNGATLENNPGHALEMGDTAKATLNTARVTRVYPDGCAPAFATVSLFESAALTLTKAKVIGQGGVKTTGLQTNGTGLLTLDSTEVTGFTETGIVVRAANSKIMVRHLSLFAGNHIGIDARFATAASLTVTNTMVVQNDVGILAAKARIRTSSFDGNREAGVMANGAGVDLGTALSPGRNGFTSRLSTGTGVTFLGSQFSGAVNSGVIKAVGNTWGPLTQGSDAGGHYTTRVLVDGTSPNASGTNFVIPNANTKIQL